MSAFDGFSLNGKVLLVTGASRGIGAYMTVSVLVVDGGHLVNPL
ncbi:hypothetical protein NVV93_10735 [Pseudomonas sp. LS44]|nr:hypothetical protein [Pseudomonas sp. LS44]UVE16114.1 hypothetical protein NVV93_10735 [Pseudomonas sp. LS44]